MPGPQTLTSSKLLIVEGKDEENFFLALFKQMGLNGIQILSIGGKDKFKATIKALISTENFSSVVSIGIVRDADNDATAAFQSVVDAVKSVKLQAPDKPLNPSNSTPKIIIMIMPAFNKTGSLEDLCLSAVQDHPVIECVDKFIECIRDRVDSPPKGLSKSKVQVFLASKSEPSQRKELGVAALAGYWPLEADTFNQVKEFIRNI